MNWCTSNKMTINIGKIKYMFVTPLNSEYMLTVGSSIGHVKLSQVHVNEYSGIYIDDKLTMIAQIDKVCMNVQNKYGILRVVRSYISLETAVMLYKVMIEPDFDYGDYMIESEAQGKIDKLERIEDKIVRTTEYEYGIDKHEDMDILKIRYNIEKLCITRKRNLLKIMFKQSHKNENIDYYRPDKFLSIGIPRLCVKNFILIS